MLEFIKSLFSNTIYIELHKDKVFIKQVDNSKTFEGELWAWKYNDPEKENVTVAIGSQFTPLNSSLAHISENQTQKQKVFYNKENLVIDDFEIAQTALSHIFSTRLIGDTAALVKPIVIINVPEDASPVELRVLRDTATAIGGRACFVISEASRPMDHQFENLDQQNFNFLYQPKEYTSNKKLAFILLLSFALVVLALGLQAMGIDILY
jgi:MreB/Mbl protein